MWYLCEHCCQPKKILSENIDTYIVCSVDETVYYIDKRRGRHQHSWEWAQLLLLYILYFPSEKPIAAMTTDIIILTFSILYLLSYSLSFFSGGREC